jgi:hypothetical protein
LKEYFFFLLAKGLALTNPLDIQYIIQNEG